MRRFAQAVLGVAVCMLLCFDVVRAAALTWRWMHSPDQRNGTHSAP